MQVAQSLGIQKLDLFLIVLQAMFAKPHGKVSPPTPQQVCSTDLRLN